MSDPVSKPNDTTVGRIHKQLVANIWLNIAALVFAGLAISYSVFVYNSEITIEQGIVKILEQQGNISKTVRDRIIESIITNENVTIPNINKTLVQLNATQEEFYRDTFELLTNMDNKVDELFFYQGPNDTSRSDIFKGVNRTG